MTGFRWDAKEIVEECKSISVAVLKKNGKLKDDGSDCFTWVGRQNERGGTVKYIVALNEWDGTIRLWVDGFFQQVLMTAQPCHYGGKRWWFVCPLARNRVACEKKVKKLYFLQGFFGCRHCHNLTYRSVQMHDKKADALIKDPEKLLQIFKSQPAHLLSRAALGAMLKMTKKKKYKGLW